jgi:hypothetical protein
MATELPQASPTGEVDAQLEARITEIQPLGPDDYQAVLHARTIRRIADVLNVSASDLDFAHDAVESLESQETFSALVDAAAGMLRRAAEHPNTPLPTEAVDALRAMTEMVA